MRNSREHHCGPGDFLSNERNPREHIGDQSPASYQLATTGQMRSFRLPPPRSLEIHSKCDEGLLEQSELD